MVVLVFWTLLPLVDKVYTIWIIRAPLNIKTVFLWKNLRYKDKAVEIPSYLYDYNPYSGNTIALCWDGPQANSCE